MERFDRVLPAGFSLNQSDENSEQELLTPAQKYQQHLREAEDYYATHGHPKDEFFIDHAAIPELVPSVTFPNEQPLLLPGNGIPSPNHDLTTLARQQQEIDAPHMIEQPPGPAPFHSAQYQSDSDAHLTAAQKYERHLKQHAALFAEQESKVTAGPVILDLTGGHYRLPDHDAPSRLLIPGFEGGHIDAQLYADEALARSLAAEYEAEEHAQNSVAINTSPGQLNILRPPAVPGQKLKGISLHNLRLSQDQQIEFNKLEVIWSNKEHKSVIQKVIAILNYYTGYNNKVLRIFTGRWARNNIEDVAPIINAINDLQKIEECIDIYSDAVSQWVLSCLNEVTVNNSDGSLATIIHFLGKNIIKPRSINAGNSAVIPDAEIPPEFICPITTGLMSDPVLAPYDKVFERSAINQWRKTNNSCPLTRGHYSQPANTEFPKNYLMQLQIEVFKAKRMYLLSLSPESRAVAP